MKINFPHSKKVVMAAIIAVGVTVVGIAVRNTFRIAVKYSDLTQRLNDLGSNGLPAPRFQAENNFLLKEIDFEKEVFASVSQSCQQNHVNLKQVQSPKISNNGKVSILTQQVTFQGDFVKILKSLQDIQTELSSVKISSLKFEKEETNKVQSLVAHVYFQGVKYLQENDE